MAAGVVDSLRIEIVTDLASLEAGLDRARASARAGAGAIAGDLVKVEASTQRAGSASAKMAVDIARLEGGLQSAGTASGRLATEARKLQTALEGGGRDRAADIAAYGQELDRLRAKFNPLFAAQQEYRQELDAINQAARVGAISERERAAAMERTKAAFAGQVNELRGVSGALEAQQREAAGVAASFARLEQAYDSTARASSELAHAQATIQKAVAAGITTQDRGNQLLAEAQTRYGQAGVAAGQAGQGFTRFGRQVGAAGEPIKLTSHQMLNLSHQLTDFAVQVGSGQGIFRPLLQQAPQAVDAMGGLSNATALVTGRWKAFSVTTRVGLGFGAAAIGAGLVSKALLDLSGHFASLANKDDFEVSMRQKTDAGTRFKKAIADYIGIGSNYIGVNEGIARSMNAIAGAIEKATKAKKEFNATPTVAPPAPSAAGVPNINTPRTQSPMEQDSPGYTPQVGPFSSARRGATPNSPGAYSSPGQADQDLASGNAATAQAGQAAAAQAEAAAVAIRRQAEATAILSGQANLGAADLARLTDSLSASEAARAAELRSIGAVTVQQQASAAAAQAYVQALAAGALETERAKAAEHARAAVIARSTAALEAGAQGNLGNAEVLRAQATGATEKQLAVLRAEIQLRQQGISVYSEAGKKYMDSVREEASAREAVTASLDAIRETEDAIDALAEAAAASREAIERLKDDFSMLVQSLGSGGQSFAVEYLNGIRTVDAALANGISSAEQAHLAHGALANQLMLGKDGTLDYGRAVARITEAVAMGATTAERGAAMYETLNEAISSGAAAGSIAAREYFNSFEDGAKSQEKLTDAHLGAARAADEEMKATDGNAAAHDSLLGIVYEEIQQQAALASAHQRGVAATDGMGNAVEDFSRKTTEATQRLAAATSTMEGFGIQGGGISGGMGLSGVEGTINAEALMATFSKGSGGGQTQWNPIAQLQFMPGFLEKQEAYAAQQRQTAEAQAGLQNQINEARSALNNEQSQAAFDADRKAIEDQIAALKENTSATQENSKAFTAPDPSPYLNNSDQFFYDPASRESFAESVGVRMNDPADRAATGIETTVGQNDKQIALLEEQLGSLDAIAVANAEKQQAADFAAQQRSISDMQRALTTSMSTGEAPNVISTAHTPVSGAWYGGSRSVGDMRSNAGGYIGAFANGGEGIIRGRSGRDNIRIQADVSNNERVRFEPAGKNGSNDNRPIVINAPITVHGNPSRDDMLKSVGEWERNLRGVVKRVLREESR